MVRMRSWQYALIALGVFVWVIAVFLMVEGSILGERTTGIATLLGMVGMFVILITYMHALMLGKAEKSSKVNLNKAFLNAGFLET